LLLEQEPKPHWDGRGRGRLTLVGEGGDLCSPTLSHKISISLPSIYTAKLLPPPDAPLSFKSAPNVQCTGQTDKKEET